jgi:hypothetical protein
MPPRVDQGEGLTRFCELSTIVDHEANDRRLGFACRALRRLQ